MIEVILISTISTLIFTLIIFSIATFLITYPEYKYYKLTYNKLKENKNKCYKKFDLIYLKETEIIIFPDNSVKLDNSNTDIYLHNTFYNYFFIYNLYWFMKYKKLAIEIRKNLE